jgi:cell division FtsZ-interacting protein ZapD
MRGLLMSEHVMMSELTKRLSSISSPVVRSQLLLQMSQMMDVVLIGDTSSERERDLNRQIEELQDRLNDYEPDTETPSA